MSERLIALGRHEELRLQAKAKAQMAEELRKLIRESLMVTVPLSEIDSSRVLLLAGELHHTLYKTEKGKEGYVVLLSEMKKIEEEQGIR